MCIGYLINKRNISSKMLNRYIKDYKLPIKVVSSPYFKYYCNLYNKNHNIKESFNDLLVALDDFDTEEDFLDYCNDVKKNMVNFIKDNKGYRLFTELDVKELGEPITLFSRNSLYTSKNVGKKFISIDLKKANFQAIKKIAPDVFGLSGDFTYEEFISKFTNYNYLIKNRQFRQAVFGELSPKHQAEIQKVFMNKVKILLESNGLLDSLKLAQATNDELVYEIESDSYIEDLKFVREVCELELAIEKLVKKELNIDIRIQSYELCSIMNSDKVFVKEIIGEEIFRIVNASALDYAQYFKAYKNMTIDEYDLLFYHEGRLCKFMEPIFNNEDIMRNKNKSSNIIHECTQCRNLETESYIEVEDETLCNNWCSKGGDVFRVYKEKYCEDFIQR